jgi:hypothetical protein
MSKTPKMLKGGAGNVVGSALSPINIVRVMNDPNSNQGSNLMITNYNKGFGGNASLEAFEQIVEEKEEYKHELPFKVKSVSPGGGFNQKGNNGFNQGFMIGGPVRGPDYVDLKQDPFVRKRVNKTVVRNNATTSNTNQSKG